MNTRITQVEFGSHLVDVPQGGYYDRFRMNPDLDEVANDPAAGNIDWFRRIPKRLAESRVGPIWAPNFYYRSSNVQLLFLAPLARLRAALPEAIQPLRAIPGYGLVALTFFSYSVCDNDPYDEVSVAIVIRRPGSRKPHALELLDSMRRRHFYAHVLALPVTTEIARVRGVFGYQLPKWRADIDVDLTSEVSARIVGPADEPDVTVTAPLPPFAEAVPQSRLGASTMVHSVDGQWHQTTVQTNTLKYAQRLFPRDVTLARGDGPLSQLLEGLGASTIIRMDVVKDAQLVLDLPKPLQRPIG